MLLKFIRRIFILLIVIIKMKRLFQFKYPKIAVLLLLIGLAYIIFSNKNVQAFVFSIEELKYLGSLIAGLLFSFGFTTPFAVGYFLVAHPQNLIIHGIIGGFGALISDMIIFKTIKFSFTDEFNKLKKTKIINLIIKEIDSSFNKKIRNYLIFAFAGIIIASPLPDELGITMLAGLTKINSFVLAIISFAFNTLGILILLAI